MRGFYHGLKEKVGSTTLQNNRQYKYNDFTYITNELFCI